MKKIISAITAAVLPAIAAVAISTGPAQAVGNTFACNSDLYQVSDGAGAGGIGGLYKFNMTTQAFERVGSGSIAGINAAGRNPADGYLYAFDGSNLVRIDNAGTFTTVGAVSGSPKTTGGDFLPWSSGDAFMLTVGRNAFTKVNVNTLSATAFNVTNGNLWGAADITISPDGTKAYGMDGGTLDILDLTQNPPVVSNKTVTNAGSYNYGSSFGAAYTDSAGDLFFYANYGSSQGGYMYTIPASQLANSSPIMTEFGAFSGLQGPNDGASCGSAASIFAPVVTTDQVSASAGSATLTGTVSTDSRTGSDIPASGIKICFSASNATTNGLLSSSPDCGDASPSSLAIATNATAVSRTVSGLTGNEYYQVKATNSAGLTGFGAVLQLTGGGSPSPTPTPTPTPSVTTYTVHWDAQGGAVSPTSDTVADGSPVSLPTPTRSGYTFDGWFTAAAPNGTQQSGSFTVNGSDVTFYAHWTANPPAPTTYNVYFTNLGGYVSQGGGVAGAVINCPSAPVRPGYTFKGWGTCAAGGSYTITGNITLEAQWEKTTVPVTFTSNGSTVNTQNPAPGSVIDCPAAPTRAGYTFMGWPGCVDGKYTVTGTATIDAKWEKTAYPVTFSSNGSTLNSVNATVGSVIDCPAAPTRAGYTFIGWPGCVDGKYTVTGAATIVAQWIENLAPVPNPPAAGGGQTDHSQQPTTLLPNGNKDGLKLTAPGWSLDLIGKENGVNVPLDALGRIVFQEGHMAHTSGSGFKPNSDVHVYIFSTPILLGILHTDANGEFVGDLPLPAGLAVGDHIVQVDGYAPDNSVRTADVPVVYAAAKPVTLSKSVYFTPDSTVLSMNTIQKITNLVKNLPAGSTLVTAKIVGFVYPINSAAANKKISDGRAKNIAALLKKLGVKGDFTVIGAGRDKVADPTARRVDVAITYTKLVTAP